MSEKLSKHTPNPNELKMPLESAWVTICRFAPQCWDSLDDLEESIGSITGETSVQVNHRLFKTNRIYLKGGPARENEHRQKVIASQRELLAAMPTTNHPSGRLLKVVAHYERGTQTIDGDVITCAVAKARGDSHGS